MVFATRPLTGSRMPLLVSNLALMRRRTLAHSPGHLGASMLLLRSGQTFLVVPLHLFLRRIRLRYSWWRNQWIMELFNQTLAPIRILTLVMVPPSWNQFLTMRYELRCYPSTVSS